MLAQASGGEFSLNAGIARPSVHAGSPLAPLTLGLPRPFRGGFLPQYGQGLQSEAPYKKSP
jgi:hypothetical protein